MKEGWHSDDYIILFEEGEIEQKNRDYEIDRLLPGHSLVGIVRWDDFLVEELGSRRLYTVPSVPINQVEKKQWVHQIDAAELKADERYTDKIKWYVKPVVFGGDPNFGENTAWISHSDHVQLVKFWNQIYADVAGKQ